ncbi:hypothetical protein [Acinetobacter oleivorans]|jgi:hypothetical protein|uniref:hypothetical protein n=1 Tax=Acinetobacter oleivorans TaxID=1148157 RepID=UPI00125F67DC|nr:hypothetical protein [Acinetobacter oleivorans]
MTSHGRKLTLEEYEHSITELFEDHGNNKETLERKELNLTIDYRLGVDFPLERREELWKIHQKIEKERNNKLLKKYIMYFLPNLFKDYKAAKLVNFMLKEYSTVLSEQEIKDLFLD